MIPETAQHNGQDYRLYNLCVGNPELEDTLERIEDHDLAHYTEKHERVDVTGWPGHVNGKVSVFAVYLEPPQTPSTMFDDR